MIVGKPQQTESFAFQIALALRHGDELRQQLANGKSVTEAELAARYLPAQALFDALLSWVRTNGLHVDRTYANRVTIEVSGPVGRVEHALNITLRRVSVGSETYLATQDTPAIPSNLASGVTGIVGLQPYLSLHKFSRLNESASAAKQQIPADTISGNYYPAGILRTYQALPYLSQSGAGTTTAILIDTFPHPSDVISFWSLTGIPQKPGNVTFIQAVQGKLPAPSGEESLDTEWASSIGYGSRVRVYATTSLKFIDLATGYQRILSDLDQNVPIQQLSVSLGGCEVFQPLADWHVISDLLALIAAKRVTILISSGDSGAYECGTSNPAFPAFPSTDPVVTAVGGTSLIATGSGQTLQIASETGWTGSGGGLSNLFEAPSYQASLRAPSRVVPDVAADADPQTGVVIVLNGNTKTIGGTSASAPIWAGLMSLVNQARIAEKKPALGFLNPRIYPLLGTSNFHDVTAGCNDDNTGLGYCAQRGYDLVTGLGSPVMNRLLPTLVAQP